MSSDNAHCDFHAWDLAVNHRRSLPFFPDSSKGARLLFGSRLRKSHGTTIREAFFLGVPGSIRRGLDAKKDLGFQGFKVSGL